MRVQKYKNQDEGESQNIDSYVLKAKKEREDKENRANQSQIGNHSRRWYGIRLGLGVGICFGITSELVNIYLISEVWYYSPPFGALGNIALDVALFIFISWIVSIPDETFSGVSLGCLAGLSAVELRSWLIPGASPIKKMVLDPTLILFVLVSVSFLGLLFVPVMLLWRTSIETLYDMHSEPLWNWNRVKFSLALLVLMVVVGSFLILPSDTRVILQDMNNLIESGLAAFNESELPEPLRTTSTRWILDQKDENFSLEIVPNIDPEKKSSFRSILGQSGLGGNITVNANFPGGRKITCSYQSPQVRPYCR